MQLERHGGAPTILAPHGTLSTWSLRQKRLKKALALAMSWRRSLMRLDALHALNGAECREVERELPGARVEILPNGVNLEEFAPPSQPVDELLAPLTGGRPYFLFLARLHHVKGPDRLLRAFALAVRSNMLPEVDLVIAGPDFGMLETLRGLTQDLGVGLRVRFVGPVRGPLKAALLRHALCVCQPSLYECFSITVLESLACGVPVLITPESNFPEVAAHGAGLVVDGAPEKLASALARLAQEPQMRAMMGAAGLDLVRREFTWRAVAEHSLLAYERLRSSQGPVAAKRVTA
jgi:glycosyltransferase involved in cell wall biosynthesis